MRTGTTKELFLGRYHSLERLGAGPLGETFRGRVYGLGGFEKDFAIKRLDPRLCEDPALVGRLVRAASLAAQLQSERLARIQTVDAEEGQYYLVSDLARGLDLALLCDLLAARDERLPRAAALSIALDVAEVLESCHGRGDLQPGGIAHLGLSPHAVVIDEEGEARVIGMGLIAARIAPGWSEDEAVLPRLGYLAPEVVAARPSDGRADLFSLGAILHELTSGAPDDPELATLIRRALAADLELRLQKVGELRRALELRLPERQPARRELGRIVARWLEAPKPVELTRTEVTPPPAPSDALDWDSGEIALFGGASVEGDQITNRVPTTPPKLLPAPPTLPLSAMRSPIGAWISRALRPAAVAVLLIAAGVGLGLAVRRARRPEASAQVATVVPRRAVVMAPAARVRGDLARAVQTEAPLEVATTPPGARVFVDGILRGTSPVSLRLPLGRHRLALVAEDRALERRPIELGAGGAHLSLALVPASGPGGDDGLKVRCLTPDELRIFVDGADTGRTCPNEERIPVEPGPHHLALYSPRTDETIAVHKEIDVADRRDSTRVYLKY